MTNNTNKINEELKIIAQKVFGSWESFMDRIEIYDLSIEIKSAVPCTLDNLTDPGLKDEHVGKDARFISNVISNLYTNLCTHVDFPGHLNLDNKKLVSQYLPKCFIGPAIVVDISDKTKILMDYLDDNDFIDIDKLVPKNVHHPVKLQKYFELIDKLEVTKDEFHKKLKEAHLGLKKGLLLRFCKYGN